MVSHRCELWTTHIKYFTCVPEIVNFLREVNRFYRVERLSNGDIKEQLRVFGLNNRLRDYKRL